MSSVDETQQPSYHVRASGFVPSSEPGTSQSHPESEPPNESFDKHSAADSSLDFLKNQLNHRYETLPHSIPPPVAPAHVAAEEEDKAGPSTEAGPSTGSPRWKTNSSSSSSLRASSSGKFGSSGEHFDQFKSTPIQSRTTPEPDFPTVSTPPDNDESQDKQTGASVQRNGSPVTQFSRSSTRPKPQRPDLLTPSKLPFSQHKPRTVSSRHESSNGLVHDQNPISPSKYRSTFSITSPIQKRPPSRSSPSRRKAHPPSDDNESFRGTANLKPHQQLKAMFEQVQKPKPSPSFWKERTTAIEPDTQQLPAEMSSFDNAVEPTPGIQPEQAAYHSPSPPVPSAPAQLSEPILHQQLAHLPMFDVVNHSRQALSTIDPTTLGAMQAFANLPPSSGASSDFQGPLYGASQGVPYGNEESLSPYHFPATQAVSPHKIMQEPSASSQHSSHLFSSNIPMAPVVPFVPTPVSQTSNSTHTTVPSNRRLTRVNPRVEDPTPVHPLIGPNRPVSLPMRNPAPAVAPVHPPFTVPIPYRALGDIEPTQVDERITSSPSRPPGLNAATREGYQDTYVDDAPMSPPPEQPEPPEQPATPRPSHSIPTAGGLSSPAVPPMTSPNHAQTSPASQDLPNELQPTYIDPRTLPSQPPAPRVSPRTYARAEKGRVTASPGPVQSAPPESQSFEEEEQVEERVDTPANPPTPVVAVRPTPKPKTITPRRRGKRRGSISSEFTSGGGGSDSSPAPEDPEDYTYRPMPKVNGNKRLRTRATAAPQSTRASSVSTATREPPSKRIKLNMPETPSRSTARAPANADEPTSPLTPIAASSQLGLRVFGWWAPMKCYFPGTVTHQVGDKYHIDFDDNTNKDLPLDRLRRLVLHKGDHIKADEKDVGKGVLEVLEDWTEGNGGGQRGVKVKQDGEPITPVPIQEIFITDGSIKKTFDDRRLIHSDFGARGADLKPSVSPAKMPRAGDVFAGKVFLLTTNGGSTKEQEVIAGKIKRYGGRVMDDWKRLFDLSSKGFGSSLRGKDAPFLISIGQGGLKPKAIVALASGIPCLSETFIDKAIEQVGFGVIIHRCHH